jgi:hypothetical protein
MDGAIWLLVICLSLFVISKITVFVFHKLPL